MDSSATLELSPTLKGVASELGPEPCSARQVVEAILERHDDYAAGRPQQIVRSLDWTPGGSRRTPNDWFSQAAMLLANSSGLNGKLAIVAISLLDRPSSRALTAAGVIQALIGDLEEGWDAFNQVARERANAIPLLHLHVGKGAPDLTMQQRPNVRRGGLSADGRRAVLYGPRVISVISVNSDVGVLSVPVSQDPRMVRIDESGAVVALLTDGSVERWAPSSGTARRLSATPPVQGGEFGALSSTGSVAVVRRSDTSIVRIHVADNGQQVVIPVPRVASRVAVSPSGRSIAAVVDDQILWWKDWQDGATPVTLSASAPSTTLDCSDEHVVAVTDKGLFVEGDRLPSPDACDAVGARQINMSGNGRMFAVLCSSYVDIRDVRSGIRLAELSFGEHEIERVSFNLESTRLLGVASDGSAVVWNVGVDPPPALPTASDFSNDSAEADVDLLGRSRDAEAFGALISSREMQPPLAIGVFGDWGSGKSWFMREIRKSVASIADEAARSGLPQQDLAFYKNIRQVEFNAWHYSETDVLASLADHIFRVLKEGGGSEFEKTRISLAAQLAAAQSAADATASAAAAKQVLLRNSEAELDASSRELAATRNELFERRSEDAAKQQLRETAMRVLSDAGLRSAGTAAGDLGQAVVEARRELRRGVRWITPLVGRDKTAKRRLLLLLVGFVAGPVLGVATGLLLRRSAPVVPAISAVGSVLAAWCTTVALGIRAHTAWVKGRLDSLDKFEADLWETVDNDAAVRGLKERVEAAAAQVQSAHEQLARAQHEHADALREAEVRAREAGALRPERMLSDLISLRGNERIYSKYLGVVAEARQDFQKMSDFVGSINADAEGLAGDGALNRIVLYIDDLDRCDPEKVVQVLQAVHLLLAFPLFVVVVGVDSRWVERALRDRYPGLLGSDGASPHDYLEKLFQIPVWLEPLSSAAAVTMLRGVVGRTRTNTYAGGLQPASEAASSPGSIAEDEPDVPPPATGTAGASPQPRSPSRIRPAAFTLGAHELASMEDLAGALGRSPRSLKRFVNVYRLIKVLSDDSTEFADDRSDADYRAVLVLLSMLAGNPEAARLAFDDLRQGSEPPAGEGHLQVVTPSRWSVPSDHVREWLTPWVNEVSRFGFQQLGSGNGRQTTSSAMPNAAKSTT